MIEVTHASVEEQESALSLLFRDMPDETRRCHVDDLLQQSRDGQLRLDGLLLATSNRQPVGCGFYLIERDLTGFVWPPLVDSTACDGITDDEVADVILQEIADKLDKSNAWIGQCLLELDRRDEKSCLIRNGFRHLTDLVFMECSVSDSSFQKPTSNLHAMDYEADRERSDFVDVLSRTFDDTMDCPELRGQRSADAMLAGFEAIRNDAAIHWRLYELNGEPIGIVFISQQDDPSEWEITYMGVVPEFRGQRLGCELLSDSLLQLSRLRCKTVRLAVDCRNHYAMAAYAQLGFREAGRRSILCRLC